MKRSILYNLQKLNTCLLSVNRFGFTIIITSVLYIIAFSTNYILGFIKQRDIILINFHNEETSSVILFVTTVILAPIVETFIGQSLPYKLLQRINYFKGKDFLILITAASFFGLIHFYSIFYIIYAFLVGLVLMYGYMLRIKVDNKSFTVIAICHSLLNLGIFIKNLLQW